MINLEKIRDAFPDRDVIGNIGIICYCPTDGEALEETSFFLNRHWEKIDSEIWGRHWGAVGFFSTYGFYYFLPSIILSSLENFDKTSLAVDSVLNSLCSQHILSEYSYVTNFEKWRLFNRKQLILVRAWLRIIRPFLLRSANSRREFAMADTVLFDLINEAKCLEKLIKNK